MKIFNLEKRVADLEVQVQSQQKIQEDNEIIKIISYPSNPFLSRTQVSFQLSSHDWSLLEQSKEWISFQDLLAAFQMRNIQISRQETKD
jgi:hypothetical protein